MKLIALLLSVIVLTLNSVSCCALENDEAHHTAQQSTENEDDCNQSCSPFYTCGTCVGFTVSDDSTEPFAVYLKPFRHNSMYPAFELPKTVVSIWQPPQLR